MKKLMRGILSILMLAGIASVAKADPEFISVCNRSPLCAGGVVDFEEGQDFPHAGFLEPDGVNIAPVTAGSQKLNNNAFSFSGSNFLWTPASGAFGQSFTVALWIYPTTAGSPSQSQVLLSEDGDNAYGNVIYLYNNAGNLQVAVSIRDGVDPKSGALTSTLSTGNMSLNTWHFVVVRARPKWDYTSASYDGALTVQVDNGTIVSTAVTKPLSTSGGRLFLGKSNRIGAEYYYTGRMDQLYMVGGYVTDELMTQMYNSGAGLQYPYITGNAAYSTPTSFWRFDRTANVPGAMRDDAAGFNDATLVAGTATTATAGPSASLNYSVAFVAGAASASSTYVDPASLGPTVWLKADEIGGLSNGDALTTWPDSSGNGRNFTQATAGNKPAYNTSLINGLPGVTFDGTTDALQGVNWSNLIGTQGGTIFLVAKRDNNTLSNAYFGTYNATQYVSMHGGGNPTANVSSWNHDGNSDSAQDSHSATGSLWHIVQWRHDATNVYSSSDDARDSGHVATASGATGSLAHRMDLGAQGNPQANFFKGSIAEVIVFGTSLTETQRMAVETYLANKYAISIPYQSAANGHLNLQVNARPFTVSGWAKVTTLGSQQGLVANWCPVTVTACAGGARGWRVYTTTGNKIKFEWSATGTATSIETTTSIVADTWFYFTARWTGTEYSISINNTTKVTSASATVAADVAQFYFGTTDDGATNKLTGSLSSVAWFKGLSLTDTEVTGLYNSAAGRACCPVK